MKISREQSIVIKYFLDEWFPPIIRDSRLYHIVQRVAYGDKAEYFRRFRSEYQSMSTEEIASWYEIVDKNNVHGPTDLSQKSIEAILKEIAGKNVLEIACGQGFLANLLGNRGYDVTAADFVIYPDAIKNPKVKYIKANIEALPFKTKVFETVISAHTLEHTLDIYKAVSELRRVAIKKILVVLPRERPYKFGCNFHTYFFPYEYSVYQLFGRQQGKQTLKLIGGDWFYTEKLD